ncbi:MAG: aldo/keto reductase [Lachnospiraceae bacterium]|jgi:diketogulonate reductase-like aldo/keto reductase|nr:aldo/keto reductase [Lachnospiraceae bacterium]
MEYRTLRNKNQIPAVGLGTWQITDRAQMSEVISEAYDAGYRLIDMAAAYSNEIAIAKAIAARELPRTELFLSDKVWNTSRGYEAVQEACKRSLKKLKTEYFDYYLIHWPASMKLYPNWEEINADTWRGMEALYQEGLVRNIGVCNFKEHHLEALEKTAKVMPFLNQVELHPGMPQEDILQYCKRQGIVVEASSPLGNGQILKNPVICEIAEVQQVSSAQVCLRWALQKGAVVIPKSTNALRLRSNIDVFDFELTDEEMKRIDAIPYCGGIGIDPDEVEEFG